MITLTMRPTDSLSERSRHTSNGMDARFFDFAQNDRQVDGASIGITPSVMLRKPGRLT